MTDASTKTATASTTAEISSYSASYQDDYVYRKKFSTFPSKTIAASHALITSLAQAHASQGKARPFRAMSVGCGDCSYDSKVFDGVGTIAGGLDFVCVEPDAGTLEAGIKVMEGMKGVGKVIGLCSPLSHDAVTKIREENADGWCVDLVFVAFAFHMTSMTVAEFLECLSPIMSETCRVVLVTQGKEGLPALLQRAQLKWSLATTEDVLQAGATEPTHLHSVGCEVAVGALLRGEEEGEALARFMFGGKWDVHREALLGAVRACAVEGSVGGEVGLVVKEEMHVIEF